MAMINDSLSLAREARDGNTRSSTTTHLALSGRPGQGRRQVKQSGADSMGGVWAG